MLWLDMHYPDMQLQKRVNKAICNLYDFFFSFLFPKDTFECVEITETHVILRYLSQEDVIQRLGEEKTDIIAVNLVQQL
jgi:hypothetical protein